MRLYTGNFDTCSRQTLTVVLTTYNTRYVFASGLHFFLAQVLSNSAYQCFASEVWDLREKNQGHGSGCFSRVGSGQGGPTRPVSFESLLTRLDPIRPDPTRPDPTRPDPTRPDPTRPDPIDGSGRAA